MGADVLMGTGLGRLLVRSFCLLCFVRLIMGWQPDIERDSQTPAEKTARKNLKTVFV